MIRLPILAAVLALTAAPVAAQGLLTLSKTSVAKVIAAPVAQKDAGGSNGYLGGALGDEIATVRRKAGGTARLVVGESAAARQDLTSNLCALMPTTQGCQLAHK
ncbi:hypothetical protein [Frigidibacter sp. ROC022]|uniref:hypothetical protein n=1 Tax=Frigidibacter sp. ROC022 TaxID=2971796 RepID=UPI00215AF869|nr:hypothetical protein [Frigidibacter sp. ROC022]MCR8724262.1 hypothetical protein [Frigidibacter sp. ROC022]